MNERIDEFIGYAKFMAEETTKRQISLNTELRTFSKFFAELIVKECASIARDTDLEDVEGGDSAVLRAACNQILEHFGVEV